MTELERTSREAVHAAEAGDLDRLAAALEARREAVQRAFLKVAGQAGGPALELTSHHQESNFVPRETAPGVEGSREAEVQTLAEPITPEVFALGEQAIAQLREIADGIRQQQVRLETIQSGFALNSSLEPRLDFRG